MSNITLSASVRQNLLSLQSTSDLLAQTQNRLATGNKVNTALDNPTNYFTAQSLNNRSSDISNLLDSVGNGVQVLQAANTGITSLQSLIASAKSVANQALQATTGYSTKSQFVSSAITGATASNLLGTATPATGAAVTAGTFSTIDVSSTGAAATSATVAEGTFSAPIDVSGAGSNATNATEAGTVDLTAGLTDPGSDVTFTINSQTVTLTTGTGTGTAGAFSLSDIETAINNTPSVGVNATDDGSGHLVLTSTGTAGASDGITTAGLATAGLGIADGTNVHTGAADAVPADSLGFSLTVDGTVHNVSLTAATIGTYNTAHSSATVNAASLSAADVANVINAQVGSNVATVNGSGNLAFTSTTTGTSSNVTVGAATVAGSTTNTAGIQTGTNTGSAPGTPASEDFTLTVDGTAHNIDISKAAVDTYNTAHSSATLNAASLSVDDVAKLVNSQIGSSSTVASVVGGALTFTSSTTGTASNITTTAVTTAGGATGSTGVVSATNAGTASTSPLDGLELTIGATAGGTATDITFGSGTGKVSTLDQLNTALAANNLEASIDTTGKITITTSNDVASSTIGAIGGSAISTVGSAFASSTVAAPVNNIDAQNNRATLVSQYNTIIDQIQKTAQDSSFNGVNLLNGDQLKLVFNETGSSTLNIQGVTDDPAGLGLSSLTAGTDFLDNASTNKVLDTLNSASDTLRSQASTLGSNLSIVQIRQDFSKNLINVLQTGASNLTLADTNEEAANSQALSTRQSIAVSALALANTSQQSVLRLLQ